MLFKLLQNLLETVNLFHENLNVSLTFCMVLNSETSFSFKDINIK